MLNAVREIGHAAGHLRGTARRKESLEEYQRSPKTSLSPAWAQAVPSISMKSQAMPGENTCAHPPHLTPSKVQG